MTDKNALIQPDRDQKAIPIHLVDKDGLEAFLKTRSAPQRAAIEARKFEASAHDFAVIPAGDEWEVVAGVADAGNLNSWSMAKMAEQLPAGTYRREGGEPGLAMFGWVTGQYQFDLYRSEPSKEGPRVLLAKDAKSIGPILAEAEATSLVRDMVNTPAEHMDPAQIEAEAETIAKANGAQIRITKGDLLEREFPMVHMVGRAAGRSHAPRMIELEWGNEKHPRIAIVGKGVSFDTGGLDLKPSSGMLLMKKDMGGAAHALALAKLIMESGLKVRLHLLLPAAENSVSSNSFRPGDVLNN